MTTAKQVKINTNIEELAHTAYANRHKKVLLEGGSKCIMLYKEHIITKQQLTVIYKSAIKQTKCEIKIKQMQIELEYYCDAFKCAFSKICNKVQHIPISENDTVTTEEPDEAIITYEYINIDDSNTYEYVEDAFYKYNTIVCDNIYDYVEETFYKYNTIVGDNIYEYVEDTREREHDVCHETFYKYDTIVSDNIYEYVEDTREREHDICHETFYKYDTIVGDSIYAVSYTHLTLPTILRV